MHAAVLSGDIWCNDFVKAAAKKAKQRIFCVAYVTREVRGLLKRGDVLICDASESARASGETDPRVLLKLVKAGVSVASYEGLHVKCAVLGNSVLVGSANMSESSATRLTDMSVLVSDRRLVTEVKLFAAGLLRDPAAKELDAAILKKMVNVFKPKQRGGGCRKRKRRSSGRGRMDWLMNVHTPSRGMSDEENKAAEKCGADALVDVRGELWWVPGETNWYYTSDHKESRRISPGDRIIMVDHGEYKPKGRADVYGPGVVYYVGTIGRYSVVHYSCPRRSVKLSDFKNCRIVRGMFKKGLSNYPNRHLSAENFDALSKAIKSIRRS